MSGKTKNGDQEMEGLGKRSLAFNHRKWEREDQKEGVVRVCLGLHIYHCAWPPPSQFKWSKR